MQAEVYEWQSDFALKHIAEGRAKGRDEGIAEGEVKGRVEEAVDALLIVLESHGFTIDEDLRQRITTCQDLEQIHTWMRHAATAGSVDEIFA